MVFEKYHGIKIKDNSLTIDYVNFVVLYATDFINKYDKIYKKEDRVKSLLEFCDFLLKNEDFLKYYKNCTKTFFNKITEFIDYEFIKNNAAYFGKMNFYKNEFKKYLI